MKGRHFIKNLRRRNGSADNAALRQEVTEAVARADAVIAAVKALRERLAEEERQETRVSP